MIDNIAVGPPMTGFPGNELREAARSPREDGSGSFSRTLGDKIDPKVPKATTAMDNRERAPGKAVKEREGSPPRRLEPEAAERPGTKRAEGAREKAIRKFMDSFESEFGIPPTRIVEAMASIEPQKMNELPEATVEDVIGRLDLEPEEREHAMAMYAGLLAQLQVIDQSAPKAPAAPLFVKADAPMTAPHVQERFQAAHAQRADLNASLDRMNQKFWMKDRAASADALNPFAPGKTMPDFSRMDMSAESADEATIPDEMSPQLRALLDGEDAPALPGLIPEDVEMTAPSAPTGPEQAPAPARMKQVLSEMKRAADEAKRAEIQAKLEAAGFSVPPAVRGATVSQAAPAVAGPMSAPSEQAAANPALIQGLSAQNAGEQGQAGEGFASRQGQSEGRGESSSSSSGQGGDFRLASTAPTPLKLEDVAAALKTTAPVGAAALTMSPADNEANVRQLMNQAQYLIKKGGGEVKVVMNPEGLGPVQLKVLVQDGKVNVQMATESSEAKKAIESSLPELRSSLAAHKLSVDHVKVDVVSGPNTDNQARNEANPNLNQQRDTRQFWNQFQENFGNRGQREGFMDMPAMKEYRRVSEPQPLEPSKLESTTARPSVNKGRGLNLVA